MYNDHASLTSFRKTIILVTNSGLAIRRHSPANYDARDKRVTATESRLVERKKVRRNKGARNEERGNERAEIKRRKKKERTRDRCEGAGGKSAAERIERGKEEEELPEVEKHEEVEKEEGGGGKRGAVRGRRYRASRRCPHTYRRFLNHHLSISRH